MLRPARAQLDPTEAELRYVEAATCRATTRDDLPPHLRAGGEAGGGGRVGQGDPARLGAGDGRGRRHGVRTARRLFDLAG
ncbi:hypothetical protein [Streptomyces sp. enrichment culture]|uniref:hypothetical protein n=1 Tax=Streptomyces sp. enrichment culture TaxID=1795815 RepID=UPI003F579C48